MKQRYRYAAGTSGHLLGPRTQFKAFLDGLAESLVRRVVARSRSCRGPFFSPTRADAIDPSGFTNIDVGAESDDLHAYMDLYGVDLTTAEIGDLASIEGAVTLSEQYSDSLCRSVD